MNSKVWILTATDDSDLTWTKPFTTRERAIDFILREENEIADEDGEDHLTASDLNKTGYLVADHESTFSGTCYLLSEEQLDQ